MVGVKWYARDESGEIVLIPPRHAAISLGLALAVGLTTRSPEAGAVAFGVGVFIDLDHLADYYRWFIRGKVGTVWFFLHSYEILLPLVLTSYAAGWHPLLLAATVAFLTHLLCDQFTNPVRPWAYFLSYRAAKRFQIKALIEFTPEAAYRQLMGIPLLGWIAKAIVAKLDGPISAPKGGKR